MKKVLSIVTVMALSMSGAMAQSYIANNDNLGAHNNGGRGCAGCHAPHSGARGGGGTVGTGTATALGVSEGDDALWGQDINPLNAQTLNFGDGNYSVTINGGQLTSSSDGTVSGIGVCLSCHDGNLAKGAMMTGVSYEQAWGLLSFAQAAGMNGGKGLAGSGTNTYTQISSVPLYGSAVIPTLLGADGGQLGDYSNDHPVGPTANLGKILKISGTTGNDTSGYGLTATLSTSSTGSKSVAVTWAAGSQYAQFVSNYGAPDLKFQTDTTATMAAQAYVVCTTCHNQHSMNMYSGKMGVNGVPMTATGTFKTYFFINAPYNPGAAWSPTAAPSTTQFCRQCHFSHSNESLNINNVTTAY
jgi:cytochrome c553